MGKSKVAIVWLTIATLSAIASHSCAGRKMGNVSVEFLDGPISDVLICKMWADGSGKIIAQCKNIEVVAQEMREKEERRRKMGNGGIGIGEAGERIGEAGELGGGR